MIEKFLPIGSKIEVFERTPFGKPFRKLERGMPVVVTDVVYMDHVYGEDADGMKRHFSWSNFLFQRIEESCHGPV